MRGGQLQNVLKTNLESTGEVFSLQEQRQTFNRNEPVFEEKRTRVELRKTKYLNVKIIYNRKSCKLL